MILLLFLIKVFSQCGNIQPSQDFSSVDVQVYTLFSIGIWTKYQSHNIYVEYQQKSWTVINMVTQSGDNVLKLIIDYDKESFRHTWVYTSGQSLIQQNNFLYDSKVNLDYMKDNDLQQQTLMFYLWPFGKDFKYIENIHTQDILLLNDFLYKASIDTQFQGYFSKIMQNIHLFFDQDLINFVKDCTLPLCIDDRLIIVDQINFEQNLSNHFDLGFPINITYNYSIGQWVKIDLTQIENIAQIFIFGVKSKQMYLNDDFYQMHGDYSVFKIYLNYNLFVPEANSFLVNTYSYITPIPGEQRERFILHIPIPNINYLKYWIYIEYQHFQLTSQVLLYYSIDQKYYVTQFDQPIKHFSNIQVSVIYQLDYGQPLNQLLVGQIQKLNYNSCFINQQYSLICSISCRQCQGPQYTQCLNCNSKEETFRLFNPSTQSCKCIDGYIDTFEKQCKSISQIFGQNIIIEESIEEQQCKPGQFKGNNNKCFQCPTQYQENQNILCGNCYEDPQQIKKTLLCTYDFIYDEENMSYQNITRPIQDYQFYLLNLDDGRFIYFNGALGFCDLIIQTNCYVSAQQNYNGEITMISCLPNYIWNSTLGSCIRCDNNCLVCNRDTNICDLCQDSYTLFNSKCVKCPPYCLECQNQNKNQNSIKCNKCIEGYRSYEDKCKKCGSNCQICYTEDIYISNYDYIDRCVKCADPFNQYISSDGVNCLQNEIENCQIQYVYDELTKQSSFDVHVNEITDDILNPQRAKCALCQPGYINTLNACIPDSTLSQTDQVVQINQNVFKIIKSFDKDQLLKSTCKLDMCELCIFPYDQQQVQSLFCIQCQIGFYSHYIYGTCQSCPSQCYKCIHQHKIYKDAWKWQIKAFNYFILDNQDFNISPQIGDSNYEAICTDCINGLELYEGNCIKPCDPSCEKCIKQDGLNKCVSCKDTYYSIYNHKCIQCLNTCKFCIINTQNTQTQTQNINFQNQHCLIPQSTPNLYYYNYNYKQCEQNNQCQEILNITLNVYCDPEQYELEKQNASDLNNFRIYNLKISDIFVLTEYSNFGEIEKAYLLEYYNQIQLDKAYYFLNIIPNQSGLQCYLSFGTKLRSLLQSNVQGLIEQHIIFFSQNQVMLSPQQEISFQQFSSLSFINVGFQSSQLLVNFTRTDKLIVKNSILLKGDLFINQSINFVALDVKQVLFENVVIKTVNQNINPIFSFNSPLITINNFTIIDINLTKTSIFQFDGNFGGSLILKNFNFYGYFKQSTFIKINNINIDFVISIDQGYFELILDDNSSIFLCPQIKNIKINDIQFQNSIFRLNSFFFQSLEAKILRSQFINIQLYSSFIYQSTQQGGSQFTFQNLIFNNIQYDNQSFLINIIQSFGQALIHDLEVNDTSSNFNNINIYSLFTIQINEIIIKDIRIVRTSGLNEFKLVNTNNLIIQDVQFTQKESFRLFGLQSFECLQRELKQNIFQTGLNIRNFSKIEISNLNVSGIQTVNYPFILIQQISRSVENIFTTLKLRNCYFFNNQILINQIDILTSLILIQSDQQGNISLNNITVSQNIMVDFIQDMFYNSALFIVVDALYQNVNLNIMTLSQNFIVNSSQSVMRFKAQIVLIENSNFEKQNLYNYQVLKQWLFYGFDQGYQVYHETLQILFPQISQGSVSSIYARKIIINNSKFVSNRARNGGSLYLTSLDSIQIANSQFIDSKAQINSIQQYQLNEFESSGGALYIVSESSNLSLLIYNSSFMDCSATKQGGSIYIDQTTSDVSTIHLENITIINSVSLQGSFIKLSSQQNKQNSLRMINIQIKNTFEKLNQFLGSILLSRQTDLQTYIQENHLINIEYSNILIDNLFVQDLYYMSLFRLHNNNQIQLQKVRINNIQIFNQTIIDIDQNQILGKNSYLDQLQIQNLSINQTLNPECQENSGLLIFSKQNSQCFQNELSFDLQNFINLEKIQNIQNCNINKLSQFAKNEQYLLDYKTNQQQHKLYFKAILLKNIHVPLFQSGLFIIQSISNQIYENIIQLQQIKIINCQCGLQGCFNILGVNNLRLMQESNKLYQSLLQLPQTVKIFDSLFINNTAYQGTLNINNVDILINNTIISNNIVKTKGGGIYYEGNRKLYIYFTKISQNTAQEGGAIYLQNFHQSQQISSDLEIDSNIALQFSNGIAEFPNSLTIIINNQQFKTRVIEQTEQNYYEDTIIPNYRPPGLELQSKYIYLPSGQQLQMYYYFDEKSQQYLKYNLSLRIVALNSQNQIIQNLNGTYCIIQGKSQNQSNFTENYFSQSKFQYDLETNSYNLDDLIIYFNPYQQDYLIIEISCSSIKTPKYSNQPPYQLTGFYNNYKLYLKVKTFESQRGEFYNQTEYSCKQCDSSQQFYTVIPGGKCQIKNDINTKSLTSARLELRNGYWRPTETNDKISECYHLKTNCQGGWQPGDQSCLIGQIGALCEQCDIYNTRGDGKYAISKQYQCGNCNQTQQNDLIILFISLWTLISILITVKGTVETVQWTTQQIKLKKIGLRMEIYKENNSSILVNLFSNYILILGSISTFQLNLPNGFGELVTNIGNPVQAMSYSLDCFLVDLTSIEIIYFRVIWAIIMPIIYSSAFITCYILIIKLKKASYSFSVISTSLIYIYAYMQPNLIGAFISLLSYRNISNVLWIQGNVAYEYLTLTHYKWIYAFLSPALFIFGFFIPLILYFLLRKNKNNLNNPKFRLIWGYMYNEYLDNAYFWEIIKICQREIIIIILTFYQDQVMLKAALVFLIVICYDVLSKNYLPYKTRKMNHLDSNASLICASSIVSGQIIFAATQSGDIEITWPFYLFLIIINSFFILKMVVLILQAYIRMFNNIIESAKLHLNLKFPNLKYTHPRLGQFLEPEQSKKQRINQLISKILKALMPHAKQISMFRKYTTQTISVSQMPKESKFYNAHTFLATPNPTDRFLVMDTDINTKNQDDDRIIENQNIEEEEIEDSDPQFQRSYHQDSQNYVRQSIE